MFFFGMSLDRLSGDAIGWKDNIEQKKSKQQTKTNCLQGVQWIHIKLCGL